MAILPLNIWLSVASNAADSQISLSAGGRITANSVDAKVSGLRLGIVAGDVVDVKNRCAIYNTIYSTKWQKPYSDQ